MPPKKTPPTDSWQDDILAKLTYLTEKVESMEAALKEATREKESLKQIVKIQTDELAGQAIEIADLRNCLNEREQYSRNWSMRALNIPIPSDSETNSRHVMQIVYDSLLYPILEGARSKGEITAVPNCDTLLETAHILPGKAGAHKPVILRFYSRYWRNLVFRHRKEFAPREQATGYAAAAGGAAPRSARMKYPFFEDLTRATFIKLNTIKQHEEVTSAWTVNGTIRFKVKDKTSIFKVNSINDDIEDIIN
jgi:hypothetical protein